MKQLHQRALILLIAFSGFAMADSTQTVTMDLSTGLAPACPVADSGITTVTLNVTNIPEGDTVTLSISSYSIPPADSGNLGERSAAAPTTKTKTFTYTIDSTHYYVFTLIDTDDNKKSRKIRWKCGFDDTLSLFGGGAFHGTALPNLQCSKHSVGFRNRQCSCGEQ